MILSISVLYTWDCIRFARKIISERHLYRRSSRAAITKDTAKWRQLCHLFTLLVLSTYCIQGAHYVVNAWSLYPASFSCDAIEKISVILYHLGKTFLYSVLVLRIKIAFHGSTYMNDGSCVRYSVLLITLLLLSFLLITMVGDAMYITGSRLQFDGASYCLLDAMPLWGLILFGVFDVVLSLLCVVVFIYPLRLMSSAHSDAKITDLIGKYATLSSVAIGSTLLVLLTVSVSGMGWLSLMDNVVNSACLLFMSSWYRNMYARVRRLLCCGSCCRDRDLLAVDTKHDGSKNSETPRPTMTLSPTTTETMNGKTAPGRRMEAVAMSIQNAEQTDEDEVP